jgi:hypothetical protein
MPQKCLAVKIADSIGARSNMSSSKAGYMPAFDCFSRKIFYLLGRAGSYRPILHFDGLKQSSGFAQPCPLLP